MKLKNIIKNMYVACISGDVITEKKLWMKAIKKSLKGKDTQGIR